MSRAHPSRGGRGPDRLGAIVDDELGRPISYAALTKGTPVLGSDGKRVGHVAHVLADEDLDVVDGIVIAHGLGGHAFVDIEQVAQIREHGVVLTITGAQAHSLPRPSENPAVLEADPAEMDRPLSHKLRRAWDLISGDY
jgi:hypothetical protein